MKEEQICLEHLPWARCITGSFKLPNTLDRYKEQLLLFARPLNPSLLATLRFVRMCWHRPLSQLWGMNESAISCSFASDWCTGGHVTQFWSIWRDICWAPLRRTFFLMKKESCVRGCTFPLVQLCSFSCETIILGTTVVILRSWVGSQDSLIPE